MSFQGIRDGFIHWLAEWIAAPARLGPYPAWQLGSGELPPNGFWVRVRRKLWPSLKTPVLIPWLDDLRVYVYPRNEISRAVFLTGYYEPNEFYMLNTILKPGMTFLDVGANMGLYTLFAARKVTERGVVLAIEPSSREFQRLKKNVEANSLRNVRLLQVAVANWQSEADLLIAMQERSGHNTLGTFGYNTQLESKEHVQVERLDDVIRREGLTRLDVVKMDIEGAELLALQGAAQTLTRFRPIVLLELSDRSLQHQGCNSGQVWEFLSQRAYRIYAFDKDTGLPVLAEQKPYYDFDSVVAIHSRLASAALG